jgi:DNA polymerase-3 subunit epsilon
VRLRRRPTGAARAFADAGRPSTATPWREASWCALDLELTGLDPRKDHIIAVGAVPIEDGRVILGDSAYTLVTTHRRSNHGAVRAHKLRTADLQHAPPLTDALDLILNLLTGRVPVFHAAFVERSFLGPAFARRGVRLPAAADTQALGRRWLDPPGLPLSQLASRLGQATHPAHHALGDALTTAQVFIALASHLDANAPQTVGSLTTLEQL